MSQTPKGNNRLNWIKAPSSIGMGECVEVAYDGSTVRIRDSKHRDKGYLEFKGAAFFALVEDIKSHQGTPQMYKCIKTADIQMAQKGDGDTIIYSADDGDKPKGLKLTFTEAEMQRFFDGVKAGQFDEASFAKMNLDHFLASTVKTLDVAPSAEAPSRSALLA